MTATRSQLCEALTPLPWGERDRQRPREWGS